MMDYAYIVGYGKDTMAKVKVLADKVTKEINERSDNTELLRSLDRILNKIDYEELKLLSERQEAKGLSKVFKFLSDGKEKIVTKYTDIATELDNMYFSIKKWQTDLEKNNQLFLEFSKTNSDIEKELQDILEKGEELLTGLPEETQKDQELRLMLQQRLQDIGYSIGVCKHSRANISVMLKTNFTIYSKLNSTYNTTMPTLQTQINLFKALKDQAEIIESIKVISEKNNQLLLLSAKETVNIGKKSVEQIGHKKEDYLILQDTIGILKTGMEEVIALETARASDIKMLGVSEDA